MSTIAERLAAINGELREKKSINIPSININKKYLLIEDDRCKLELSYKTVILYRIKSLKDFGDVKANTLGGFVESYDNLSQDGDCWIYNNAKVYGGALINGNAKIKNLVQVYGGSIVNGYNTVISGKARIENKSTVLSDVIISDEVVVTNESFISGPVKLIHYAIASGSTINGDNKTYGLEMCETYI